MKLTQSDRYNENQDYATATLALVPIAKMTTEARRWCIWHNARPDNLIIVPTNHPDRFITYAGDALLLAQHTQIRTGWRFDDDKAIAVAVVLRDQIDEVAAQLLAVGIIMKVIPTDD